MTNKEAIKLFRFYQGEIICDKEMKEALDLAIKALDMVEQLKNMRDNVLRLYEVEDGNGDYSYGRKQVLGTVHSDLEELLEVFEVKENDNF